MFGPWKEKNTGGNVGFLAQKKITLEFESAPLEADPVGDRHEMQTYTDRYSLLDLLWTNGLFRV